MPELRLRDAGPDDASALTRLHIDSWRETYTGLLPDGLLSDLENSPYHSLESWRQTFARLEEPAAVLLVEDAAGVPVAYAEFKRHDGVLPEFRGEILRIYVRGSHQRRGLGRRLMNAMAQRMAATNLTPIVLWVLEANEAAARYYAGLGAERIHRQVAFMWNGISVPEIAFGWRDAALLIERTG